MPSEIKAGQRDEKTTEAKPRETSVELDSNELDSVVGGRAPRPRAADPCDGGE